MRLRRIYFIIISLTFAGCVTQSTSLNLKNIDSIVPIHEFATSIPKVDGLAFDNNNNLYAASEGLWGSVFHVHTNGKSEIFIKRIIRADGIVFDNKNSLYVSSEKRFGKVIRITAEGEKTTLINKIKNPEGLAFDNEGYLYIVEDRFNGSIVRYKDGKKEDWINGLERPENITFDNSGNLYVTETATNRIIQIDKMGSQSVFVDSGVVEQPDGIVYCSDYNGLFITEDKLFGKIIFVELTGNIIIVGTGFRKPQGIICDKQGNIFISEQGRNRILKILQKDIYQFLI